MPLLSFWTNVSPCSEWISYAKNRWFLWEINGFYGASGDTELFEKASNINGFQGGRVANNLYISPFWATVFQTAALFLYPNSSAVIWVENLRFLSLWLAFWTWRGCFPMREAAEAHRRTNRSKSTLFIFTGRRCEDGCIPYRKDQGLHGHVQLPSAG